MKSTNEQRADAMEIARLIEELRAGSDEMNLRDHNERDRLREICAAATPGSYVRYCRETLAVECGDGLGDRTVGRFIRWQDAEFSVAWQAKTARAALDLIEEQAAEIERLRVLVKTIVSEASAIPSKRQQSTERSSNAPS